ncbi:MAG: succinate dehydrogenase assembly factor 2 [Halofilum sp. (in: g-proteobacteria)]|nr:succinate dehydrogenase assembly factor 2 [Halofilum sp. (in: g-proteobacteria)]
MRAAVSERSRLRWLCRRGMKELDELLGRFLEADYEAAPAATRAGFERLLELPDPELYALLTGRAAAEDPQLADAVSRIRQRAGL